jgi:hypothetical protein
MVVEGCHGNRGLLLRARTSDLSSSLLSSGRTPSVGRGKEQRHGSCSPTVRGLDVSKRDAKVCVRDAGAARAGARSTVTTWGSVTTQVLALRDHLIAQPVRLSPEAPNITARYSCRWPRSTARLALCDYRVCRSTCWSPVLTHVMLGNSRPRSLTRALAPAAFGSCRHSRSTVATAASSAGRWPSNATVMTLHLFLSLRSRDDTCACRTLTSPPSTVTLRSAK